MNVKSHSGIPPLVPDIISTRHETLAPLLQEMLDHARQHDVPPFWKESTCESFYVQVEDAEIQVYHITPPNPVANRPVVFVPGWGGIPSGYTDMYEVLHGKVELYYIETREKSSSILHNRRKAKFTMNQKARDVGAVLSYMKFEEEGKDYVLLGPCWGGAIVLQGLMDGSIHAPTVVVMDPMHRLWFSKWVMKYITPLIPIWFIKILKPLIKWIKLHNMTEQVQRQRADDFIEHADLWKWKRTGVQVNDFELFGNLYQIAEEVFVINGTHDLIHDSADYPKIAQELPRGKFLRFSTNEANRELFMGLIAREFATVDRKQGIPPSLQIFEVPLTREDS